MIKIKGPKHIHTDGACSGNPGPGGWGWVDLADKRSDGGLAPHTTNNRMELVAAIEAIRANDGDLVIYSDSKYVVDAIDNGWITNWQRNGWKTSKNKPVKNQDLWEELLYVLNPKHRNGKVNWKWVKGHSTDEGNIAADLLATSYRDMAVEAKKP